jgi:ABC-type dipeptide/oligopeptide/nickel transport system permease component
MTGRLALAAVRRLGIAVFVVAGAVVTVFAILHWLPGDPAMLVAGEDAPPDLIARLRVQLGSDQPPLTQLWHYVVHALHGDFGRSYLTGELVLSRIVDQVPATLALTFAAAAVAVVLGVAMGIAAAVNRGRWLDHALQSVMLLFASTPGFWLGIVLILVFSVQLRWLPAIGNGSLAQLVLPAACLGAQSAGRLGRMARNSVIDVLDEPFVTTLRGKGLDEAQVLWRHVLRNALIPVVTLLGLTLGELLAGTVVVETLFARQGLGRLIAEAVGSKDIPMVQGAVLVAAIFYIAINQLVDLSYRWIDRRITLEGSPR